MTNLTHFKSAVIYWRNIFRRRKGKRAVTVKYSNLNLAELNLHEVNGYLNTHMYQALRQWSVDAANPKLTVNRRGTYLIWSSTIGDLALRISEKPEGNKVTGIRTPTVMQELIQLKYHNGMGEFLSDLLQDEYTKLETTIEDNAIVALFCGIVTGVSVLLTLLVVYLISLT